MNTRTSLALSMVLSCLPACSGDPTVAGQTPDPNAPKVIGHSLPDCNLGAEITANTTTVFWVALCSKGHEILGSKIMSVPKAGGTAQVLAEFGDGRSPTVVADDEALYFSVLELDEPSLTVNTIERLAHGESTPVTLFSANPAEARIEFIDMDETHIYFGGTWGNGYTNGKGLGSVKKVPKKGGPAVDVVNMDDIHIVRIDDSTVYFQTGYSPHGGSVDTPGNALWSIPKAGGDPVTLISDQIDLNDFVLNAEELLLVSDDVVKAVPKGGGPERLLSPKRGWRLAAAGDQLVVVVTSEVIRTVSLESGEERRISNREGVNGGGNDAVTDETSIYWVGFEAGDVFRVDY